MSNKTKPTHRIYVVTKRGDDRKPDWLELGAAWPHKDGHGFNMKFKLPLPPGTELVMRTAKANPPKDAEK